MRAKPAKAPRATHSTRDVAAPRRWRAIDGAGPPEFTVKYLNPSTWPDFARLIEKHNGVWGGCWCIVFHRETRAPEPRPTNRDEKKRLVREGKAHAALVYDGPRAVGWCQFGSTRELPGIKLLNAYNQALEKLPDWRITCFFVDKEYRHKGVAAVALEGAVQEIARLGGGVVESYPEDVHGRTTSNSFLYNATLAMFERAGFRRGRKLGMHHYVVTKRVRAAK